MAKTKLNTIKIKLKKSLIGSSVPQRKVVAALGLSRKDQIVEHSDSATIKGMINKVSHLLEVIE